MEDFASAANVLYNYYKDTNGNAPLASNDPIFSGNYANWARLANSMRLRVAIRISTAYPEMAKKMRKLPHLMKPD